MEFIKELLGLVTFESAVCMIIGFGIAMMTFEVLEKKNSILKKNSVKMKISNIEFVKETYVFEYKTKKFIVIFVSIVFSLLTSVSIFRILNGIFLNIDTLSSTIGYLSLSIYAITIYKNRNLIIISEEEVFILDNIVKRDLSVSKNNFVQFYRDSGNTFKIFINEELIAKGNINPNKMEEIRKIC